ncbi:MAG: OmpA family protein [Asticcacaulis sp.]
MAKGWIYALGWLVFGLFALIEVPQRAAGLQAGLRDQIEDDLEANGMTDFRVHMNGQAATLSYRDDAVPAGNPHQRMFRAEIIAGNVSGDFAPHTASGGLLLGPVTRVRADDRSLAAMQARADQAQDQAKAEASASAASSASLAAAQACTDDVTQAVAQRKLSFVTGKLTRDSDAILQDIYATLRKCPDGLVLYVEGHTDNVGGLDHNLKLSSSRADAAAAALIRLGVPAASVQSHGYGPAQPVADNTTDAGRAKNRRVDFILRPSEQGG